VKVKANKHRFTPISFGLTCSDIISKEVQFDYSCKYDIGGDQYDINKLFGVGFFHHHSNSGRFGWRWNIVTQKVELFAYVYHKNRRISEYLCSISLGEKVRLSILLEGTGYGFVVQRMNQQAVHKFIEGKTYFIGYKLGAYFGGNRRAPHDMKIFINK
jgi:hypothetical protein